MKRIALFPGSFDPLTNGHLEMIQRGSLLFDELFVGIFTNTSKTSLLSAAEKFQLIQENIQDFPNVKGILCENQLTVKCAKEVGARFLLRGMRNGKDYEYEREVAQLNKELEKDVETVFLLSSPQNQALSSTKIKEIYKMNGDIARFVPKNVAHILKMKK